MKLAYKNGITSVVLRVKILDSTVTTGAGLTALTSASAGLIISTIADNEATPTVYTAAGSTIEAVTTLGTFAAPTATKCRFKKVDDTNHPGLYEIQIADARWAVSNARSVIVTVQVTGGAQVDAEVQLTGMDLQDATAGGIARLDATVSSRLSTLGTNAPANWINAGAIAASALNGKGDWNTTTPPTAAAVATAVEQQIMDETDGRAVLAAIVAKINATDTNLAGLTTAAIAAAVWAAGARSLTDKAGFALSTNAIEDIWLFNLNDVQYDPSDAVQSLGGVLYQLHSMWSLGIAPGYEVVLKRAALGPLPTLAEIAAQVITDHGAGDYNGGGTPNNVQVEITEVRAG